MVEYGATKLVNNERKRNPPLIVFGISFGDVSYLDYSPDTKLKVPQKSVFVKKSCNSRCITCGHFDAP